MSIVRVALDVPIDELFDYRLKPGQTVVPGQRVIVPFGRGRRVGIVAEVGAASALAPERIKAVESVPEGDPPLPPDVMALARFCAAYYQSPVGPCLLTVLPPRLRETTPLAARRDRRLALTAAGREALRTLPARQARARGLLERLAQCEGMTEQELKTADPAASRGWIRRLLERQWVEVAAPSVPSAPSAVATDGAGADAACLVLSPHQQQAVQAVREALGGSAVFLLLGVTGSGKTAVYLRVMERVLAAGGQVLMLVPEINLTPQLEARVREHFPAAHLVSLHSDLAEGERLARWRAAHEGRARIVMGTRLAVFTPLKDLGLIIVDEEHDESFKQEDGLRYNARDLAVLRGKQRGVPVLLGSATPSLESYAHALRDRYRLLRLPERVAAQPPRVRCIDTRRLKLAEGLSGPLMEAIARALARGEQSLVFINRRGYSPALLCYACGWMAQCERCSARLVYHARQSELRCHHCGHGEPVPLDCPGCGNADLRPRGHGTQRLEAELARAFPAARIARVDRDTTQRRYAFADLRERVHAQSIDILVGTQMLAKGHDFPNLTLVGIVNADAVLFSTDFRAAERLFALLMQVAGRAGRAQLPGDVLIQTDFPQHPLYAAVERQDYEPFAQAQLEERRAMGFPPACHQALLRAEAPRRDQVDDFLRTAAALGQQDAAGIELFDPVPAGVARVAGRERGQLLVQARSRARLQAWLAQWRRALAEHGGNRVRWHLDVDPRVI